MCCELHPEDCAVLRRWASHAGQVGVHLRDGYEALGGLLPPDGLAPILSPLPGLVIALLVIWGKPIHAGLISVLLLGQFYAMVTLLKDPKGKAPWYNATGIAMYVSGMMITAIALRGIEVLP